MAQTNVAGTRLATTDIFGNPLHQRLTLEANGSTLSGKLGNYKLEGTLRSWTYADPRAYTDRLNALVSPQGWTRNYETVTMNNITRTMRNAEIVTGKILVTCKVTIDGLGTHSGTGEEWADEDNAMTSAEAQAFKRACSCFGLGRYFYDFDAPWVDIDERGRPKKAPCVAPWMVPDNWRKGQRPPGKAPTSAQQTGASSGTTASASRNGNSTPSSATGNKVRKSNAGNGNPKNGSKPEEAGAQSQNGSDLDNRMPHCKRR